jgi:dipeptidyl aminopeptidase/acylaminoacyl peptidase
MKIFRSLFVGLLSSFFISCGSAPKRSVSGDQIPLKDFFRNPTVNQYMISPNGKYLAYLKPYKSRMNVYVRALGQKDEKRLTSQTDRDIMTFLWKENDTLLFIRDFKGDENFHIFSVSVEGKNEKDLTPFPGVRARLISDLDGISDEEVVVGLNKRDKKVFDAYRLNIKSGELKLLAENPGNYEGWLVDHEGRLRLATATDGANVMLFYRKTENDKFKEVLKTNFKDQVDPQFFTFDNKRLYVISNLGRDKAAVAVFDPASGKETKVVYKNSEVDVRNLTYSKKRKVLISAVYTTWKTQRKFFDSTFESAYADLQSKLPEKEVAVTSMNRNEDKVIVRSWSDRSLGAYYLYDMKDKSLTHLADVGPWLDEKKLAEMRPIEYKSRDGLTIHGYLTLPQGKETNLPVVVHPHGGPWYRDSWGFDPEVQFLASRGYAVLQMNFRGSTGYGKNFWAASFKKWGREMQNDITDGVQYLVKEGIADKNKVCIYGGSYGGYAVLAGLAFTPEVYACGVDYVGVSNIFTLLETIPPYWEPARQMLYEQIGDPVKDKELLTAASPVFHAAEIKSPLFVVQGAQDPRVKKAEADQIVNALKKRGIDVPYLVKENEGHGFHNEENRFEFYSMMEDFLQKHIGN